MKITCTDKHKERKQENIQDRDEAEMELIIL